MEKAIMHFYMCYSFFNQGLLKLLPDKVYNGKIE